LLLGAERSAAPAVIVALDTADYISAHSCGLLAAAYSRLVRNDRMLLFVADVESYSRRIASLLQFPFPIFERIEDAVAYAGHTFHGAGATASASRTRG
jgi:hypothetical protein